eukprot:RCo050301
MPLPPLRAKAKASATSRGGGGADPHCTNAPSHPQGGLLPPLRPHGRTRPGPGVSPEPPSAPPESPQRLPELRMTPNFTRTVGWPSEVPSRKEVKTPTESDLKKASAVRHIAELRMTFHYGEKASERAERLRRENENLQSQLESLNRQHLDLLASTGTHDAEFTGDGTSLDKYVRELAYYKRFAGPASLRTQYLKFNSSVKPAGGGS